MLLVAILLTIFYLLGATVANVLLERTLGVERSNVWLKCVTVLWPVYCVIAIPIGLAIGVTLAIAFVARLITNAMLWCLSLVRIMTFPLQPSR